LLPSLRARNAAPNCSAEVIAPHESRLGLLRDFRSLANVIEVPMRDQNQVRLVDGRQTDADNVPRDAWSWPNFDFGEVWSDLVPQGT
jgi:hypothetical protein